MKAIILAAGQGLRLRPLTDDHPKCLVPVFGRPILDYTLQTLRSRGIDDITLVTGFRADCLTGLGLRTRHNERFDATNMVHSLFCAADQLRGDVVVSYGDIVFSPGILDALLAAPSRFSVVVDTRWRELWELRMADPLSDAETLVLDEAGRITELGKKPRRIEEIQGQYIGLFRIAGEAMAAVREFYAGLDRDALYDGQDFANMYMTSFIQTVIDRLMPVQAVPVAGGWIEVDTLEDLRAYGAHETAIRRRLGWEVDAG